MSPLHDVSRRDAGLRTPRRVSRTPLGSIDTLVIHYSTGEELGKPDDLAWWREIQRYHMETRGWDDIGYQYGIHAHLGHRTAAHAHPARILEGRGLGVAGAHAPGYNTRSIGLVILGDDDPGQDVADEVLDRIVAFRRELERTLGKRLSLLGHRQTQRPGYTQCPGDELQAWINAGMPAPGRRPPPAEEDDVTLRHGDEGPAVKGFQAALVSEASLSGRGGPAGKGLPNSRTDDGYDGIFGDETRDAVVAYQRAAFKGRPRLVTGQIDGVTAALLARYIPVPR